MFKTKSIITVLAVQYKTGQPYKILSNNFFYKNKFISKIIYYYTLALETTTDLFNCNYNVIFSYYYKLLLYATTITIRNGTKNIFFYTFTLYFSKSILLFKIY